MITKKKIPKHIAITMEGNGRWAKKQGKARIFGHKNGIKAVRETIEYALEIGIPYLTLYAFSAENWKRPKKEIEALMSLLVDSINNETPKLMKNEIKLLTIGDTGKLPWQLKVNWKNYYKNKRKFKANTYPCVKL